jgi:hypothetical protein
MISLDLGCRREHVSNMDAEWKRRREERKRRQDGKGTRAA